MGRALLNLHEFVKAYKVNRRSEGDLKTGDIVVCYSKKTICCLGKVLHTGYTELVQDHEDGPLLIQKIDLCVQCSAHTELLRAL